MRERARYEVTPGLDPGERANERDGASGVNNPTRKGDCAFGFQAVRGDDDATKGAENREAVSGGEEEALHSVISDSKGP